MSKIYKGQKILTVKESSKLKATNQRFTCSKPIILGMEQNENYVLFIL